MEDDVAVLVLGAAVGLAAAALAACVNVESAPLARDGNLTCVYGEAVVFSGGFRILGDGVEEAGLTGTWRLCRDDGVTCTLTSTRSF